MRHDPTTPPTLLRRPLGALALVVALLSAAVPARGAEEFAPLHLSDSWREALAPLEAMPVQDYGFIRSGYTFAENHLRAITGKPTVGDAKPLEAVMALIVHSEPGHDVPLLKLDRPELVAIYGAPRISLHTYRDAANHQRLVALLRSDQEKWTRPINALEYKARTLESLERRLAIVPRDGEWVSPIDLAGSANADDRRIAESWLALKDAMSRDDVAAGRRAAAERAATVEEVAQRRGIDLPNLRLDLFYHEHAPFKRAANWYLFAVLIYVAAWLANRPRLAWGGYAFIVLGLAEQIIGVYTRWVLSGRAPMSNMFESFTFAIGGMVLIAVVFEAVYRTRIVGVAAASLGYIFMVLAHKAPIFDSQINPLVPALQSSWLTYHVVTIMLSYSAFALSFFVSVVYLTKDLVLGGDATTNPLARRLPSLEAMDVFNYRIIAIGFPLLTVGIIVGAVWAATAWGRPWGFDPKETWSAITWLIYAIYLHARFLAGWQGRRAAAIAALGFLCVLFTYFGVNYLLPGLHSYA